MRLTLYHAFRDAGQRRYRIVGITAAVAELGMNLAEQHGLRGYDAVHLAAALTVANAHKVHGLSAIIFVSADSVQRNAAAAEGLPVIDPNVYP